MKFKITSEDFLILSNLLQKHLQFRNKIPIVLLVSQQ